MNNSGVEILRYLKERYKTGEVSALVGAGFSKNIDEKLFPSWSELLEDMVLFTYKGEIKQRDEHHKHIEEISKIKSFTSFQKNIVKEIIDRDGYLKVVDNYIHKKGFREAVETYIEERTPRIINFEDKDSNLKLICDKLSSDPIEVPEEKLHLHKQLLRCSWDNIFTTNYDQLLEYVVNHESLPWSSDPIINSSQLSFRTKKPIIKIHGSLADSTTKDFCFDNDHSKRYVICSEDYESYPQKHEAFTQYMRISLLKGCFCLFGFSGDDQNFISWIKWVRDILVKVPHQQPDEEKHYKVFLLSIHDDVPSREKQLFYDNHKIAYIPLSNADIKEELGVKKEETSIAVIYNAFFNYLLENQIPDNYTSLWRNVITNNSNSVNNRYTKTTEIDSETLNRILEIQSTQRFVKRTDNHKHVLNSLFACEDLTEDEVKIIVAALKDMQLLPGNYKNIQHNIGKLNPSSDSTTITDYKKLVLREKTLLGEKVSIDSECPELKDCSTYESLLYYAFNLDFSSLKQELKNWHPTNIWQQRKAMLLALFNEDESKSLLLDYRDSTSKYTEKYYVTDLLNYIYRTYPVKYSTDDFKHKGIDGIYDYLNFFIENIRKEKDKITPLGNTQTTYYLDRDTTKLRYSIRLLQTLLDLGVPLSLGISRLFDEKAWYYAFRELYEDYPFATLFYSIQVNDKDTLKRIGQEYAYNNNLFKEETIPVLIEKLLRAYLNPDTPDFYKRGILYIASELFITVPVNKWQPLFIKIWDNFFIPNFKTIKAAISDLYDFIIEALPFITPKYSKKIIIDCLTNAPSNKGIAVSCLYHLKKKNINYKNDVEYQKTVDRFIDNIASPEDFTILGNIYNSLTKSQKERITQQAGYFIEQKTESRFPTYTLSSLAYFVKGNKEAQKAFKKVLMNHQNLFCNGILTDGSFSYGGEVLKISKLTKDIHWTSEELIQLYGKISYSITQLTNSRWFKDSENRFFPIDYIPLLQEMYTFLKQFRTRLSNQDSFEHIYKLVNDSLLEKQKFGSIDEALISNEQNVANNGIRELIERIELTGIEANIPAIDILIHRVLLKKPESLLFAINTLWYILHEHTEIVFTLFERQLILILEIYKGDTCYDLNLDIPKAYSYLIKIATILRKKGSESAGINYWEDLKKSKRFNL